MHDEPRELPTPEQEMATRVASENSAAWLRHTVRTALSHAQDLDEFFNLLADAGLQVETRTLPSGDLNGYKVALPDDTTGGQLIWYSGSKLAADLSLPNVKKRLAATEPAAAEASPAGPPRRSNAWHQATAAAERIPHHLDHADDTAVQDHLTVFGEVLYALPAHAPTPHLRAELHRAAAAFEHAAHTRARTDYEHARTLRGALKVIRYQPADHTGLAMLLDAAILVVLAAQRRSALRHHDRQVAAARQTLTHLQNVYDQTAPATLAALARHRPPRPSASTPTTYTRSWPPMPSRSSPRTPGRPGHDPRRRRNRRPRARNRPAASSPPTPPGRREVRLRSPRLAHPTPQPTPRTQQRSPRPRRTSRQHPPPPHPAHHPTGHRGYSSCPRTAATSPAPIAIDIWPSTGSGSPAFMPGTHYSPRPRGPVPRT